MNGPEHYAVAEQIAMAARSMLERATPNTNIDVQRQALALAGIGQVHATLALVAATAVQDGYRLGDFETHDESTRAWKGAIS